MREESGLYDPDCAKKEQSKIPLLSWSNLGRKMLGEDQEKEIFKKACVKKKKNSARAQ